jgi:hypothetical protein
MIDYLVKHLWPVLEPQIRALIAEVLREHLPAIIAAIEPPQPAPPPMRRPMFIGERE